MKKLVILFIGIMFFVFISIFIVLLIDNNYNNDIIKDVISNTDIRDIVYVNKYNNYYIVIDDVYIYLLNDEYKEIYINEIDKLYDNKNAYEIIYKDNTIMYMTNYKNKDGIIFKYYDIYSYELIDEILVGG